MSLMCQWPKKNRIFNQRNTLYSSPKKIIKTVCQPLPFFMNFFFIVLRSRADEWIIKILSGRRVGHSPFYMRFFGFPFILWPIPPPLPPQTWHNSERGAERMRKTRSLTCCGALQVKDFDFHIIFFLFLFQNYQMLYTYLFSSRLFKRCIVLQKKKYLVTPLHELH